MTAPALAPLSLPPADARSAEILDGVRRAFAEKGFDGASMQDLARAAGMSVGNFYRYFPSKAAIVEAFVTRDLQEIERDFAAIVQHPQPMACLRDRLHLRVTEDHCNGEGQLWAEISAAALRKPEIGAIAHRMEGLIVEKLTSVFALANGQTTDEAASRFSAHAMLIVMLIKASAMTAPNPGHLQINLNELILRTIDRTLDEVASAALKG